MKRRIEWIDCLKAIAIIFVVIGHFPISYLFKKYIYSFHLPMFFILSGLTFSVYKFNDFKSFVLHKFKGILLPYIFLNISYFVFFSLFFKVLENNDIGLLEIINGIIYGNNDQYFLLNGPTWFLPTLFLIELLGYVVIKYFNDDEKQLMLVAFGLLIYGYIENVAKKNFFMPWHVNSVPVACALFLMGYLFMKKYKSSEILRERMKSPNLGYGIIFLLIGLYFSMKNGRVSFGGNHYHSMIYTLSAIIFNCSTYYIFMKKIISIKFFSRLLCYIGKNTLFILGFHKAVLILINYSFTVASVVTASFLA